MAHILTLHCAQFCDLFDTLRKNTSLTKLSVVNCQVGKLESLVFFLSIFGSLLLSYLTPDQIYIGTEEMAHIIDCNSVVSVIVHFDICPTLIFFIIDLFFSVYLPFCRYLVLCIFVFSVFLNTADAQDVCRVKDNTTRSRKYIRTYIHVAEKTFIFNPFNKSLLTCPDQNLLYI